MHRGHDVQQVRDVAAVAPSEEVVHRPRHRALRVVAVVDRDEDDAGRGGRDAVDGRGARRVGGMVPEIDGGHAARAGGRRAVWSGAACLGGSDKLTNPSHQLFFPNFFRGTKYRAVGAAVDKARAACAKDTAIESHA